MLEPGGQGSDGLERRGFPFLDAGVLPFLGTPAPITAGSYPVPSFWENLGRVTHVDAARFRTGESVMGALVLGIDPHLREMRESVWGRLRHQCLSAPLNLVDDYSVGGGPAEDIIAQSSKSRDSRRRAFPVSGRIGVAAGRVAHPGA